MFIPGLDKTRVENERVGVLLVNLGTPDAPTASAVRRYLKEFLWDPRVVESPRWLWWLVLNGIILTTRPAKSAKAYQKVWQADGSPLLTISKRITGALQNEMTRRYGDKVVVECAMRYGQPSIDSALQRFSKVNVRRICIVPLYPQYSATTTATVIDGLFSQIARWRFVPEFSFINDYYREEAYIAALAASIQEHWRDHGKASKLLMSFHSIPKRYSEQGDPYYEQCMATATALAQKLGINTNEWGVSFQSRLGREEWLRPYTDEALESLAKDGLKDIDVVCPGFAADCLETLEEIAVENRHLFLSSGGKSYSYIPALNDRADHVKMFAEIVSKRIAAWLS